MSLGSDHSDAGRGAELTQSQLLLWTGQQMVPDAPLYNMALRFDITGAVDPGIFRRAFDALIERSDAFRTIVRTRRGIPFQFVQDRIDFDLPVIDLSSKEDPDGSAMALLADRTEKSFDLGERLFDSVLLKLSADRWVWYLNQHHLVTDGWSVSVVFQALSDLYAQVAADSPGADEMLPAFADYIEFEKASRASGRTESSIEYWKRKTASLGEPPRLYGRRNQRAATGSTRTTVDLGKERSDALKQLARSDGFRSLTDHMALFNLFMTVLAALVHRVSGQKAISIGTPSHNRSTAAFRNTIGVFIEVFPFSIEIERADTFSTLYEKVRREASAFLRYARPGTSSSSVNRSFNVLLNYIPSSFSTFAGMPVASEWIHSGHGDSVHDLRLQVEDFDGLGRFRLHFDLNDEVFPASESSAVRRHFLRLLDALLDDPDESLARVDLVRLDEPHVSVSCTPPAEDALTSGGTVVDMFHQRVSEMPDAEAVTWRETSMTYSELDRRSAALARRLHDAGARPGSRIGLCVRRSPELPVGIMGILRSGATWVPLDPAAPRKRLVSLVDDAEIDILVVNEASRPLATGLTAHLLSIDDPTAFVDRESPDCSPPVEGAALSGDTCAYVLYTSGSTGRPKGVEISHAALAHYAGWAADYYTGGERKSFAVFTPVSFDLTITSLFVPLVSGGRMVLFPETSSPADVLEHVVSDPRVEIAKLTPSHLRLLTGRTFPDSGIDTLIVGGEDLKTSLGRATLDAFGEGVRVFNEYGPTEATVGCTVHRFDPDTDTGVSVPIGRPVGDAHILVVNQVGRIQPMGVEGEICVGGPGVARGYLGRPDLTGERFVDDPRRPGRTMYKTGDRGRMRTDGVLEFLGRMDEQIKIRGVRIEPGEVEHALETHPDVHDAAVVAKSPSTDGVETSVYCVRCGLPDNYPGAAFDRDGLCHLCTGFDAYERKAREYFRSMDELGALFDRARAERTADYDCLMLLSGGKDSTYALCRLVDMGLDVLAFTLDNGFISEGAKANIRRVVQTLGVDHVFGKTPAMNEIFRDSLERYSNVCNGCFKTIYTLGINLAREKGITHIVTGLSRGQFFETRLTEELFWNDDVDMESIDETILEARKAYHRTDDAVSRLLDTTGLRDGTVLDRIRFVDFYRYCDVELDEMLAYLHEHAPWTRPDDTGRSTNCLINDAGIFVHKKERGYHNYAFPYSWDVRVGHKTREQTLDELNDSIDEDRVREMLDEVGYTPREEPENREARLVAYYTAERSIPVAELRSHLSEVLPAEMVPNRFVRLDGLPLNDRGKLDVHALPDPDGHRPDAEQTFVQPDSAVERHVADIWEEVLRVDAVGATDEFLDLGGTSLVAIQIIARINRDFGIDLSIQNAFDASTVQQLAKLVEEKLIEQIESMSEEEAERLLDQDSDERSVSNSPSGGEMHR